LLDEPTTHLDVEAVDALIHALSKYEGTIVFISHDIHFVRSVANVVYEVKDGFVRKYPGNFDYYQEKKARGETAWIETVKKPKIEKKKADEEKEKARELERLRREEEKKRKSHNADIRAKINNVQRDIEKLRLEQYAKCRALADPHVFRDEETAREYGRRLKEIEKILTELGRKIKELEAQIK